MKKISLNLNLEEVDKNYDYYELITPYPWAEVSFELCANTFTLSRLDSSTLYYNNDNYYILSSCSEELIGMLPYDKVVMIKKSKYELSE